MSRKSQKQQIREYLENGGILTRLIAAREMLCFELSSRLIELTDEGMNICAISVKENGKHFCKYWDGGVAQ